MNIEFKPLSKSDGHDIYDMLQEIPADENGFINNINGRSYDDYRKWLVACEDMARGINLEDWMVPQGNYWLYVDGKPVGMGKLRHRLTEKLQADGGHAGYSIIPSHRSRGFGKLLLKELIAEAQRIGIDKLLLTVRNYNTASIKVALANGGVIEKVNDERHYIWIDCADVQAEH